MARALNFKVGTRPPRPGEGGRNKAWAADLDVSPPFRRRRGTLFYLVAVFLLLVESTGASYAKIAVVDIEGREVTIAAPARRILLASPSSYPALAILDKEAAKRVVGIGGNPGDLLPETARDLSEKPRVGSIIAGTFSIEKALALKPDIVIAGLGQSLATESTLTKAGIPLVYIDFASEPAMNTDQSFEILGRVLGAENKAAEFLNFTHQHIQTITDRLKTQSLTRQTILVMSRRPGAPCCLAAPDSLATAYFDGLGVENIAGARKQGQVGGPVQLNLESIIDRDPDVIVAAGISTAIFGEPPKAAQGIAWLERLGNEPGFRDLSAIQNARVHAIDFFLMSSPLNFLAFEALAKWAHPELFADIDPQATLDEINRRFLKTPLKGPFWVSLDSAADKPSGNHP